MGSRATRSKRISNGDNSGDNTKARVARDDVPSDQGLRAMIAEAVPESVGLTPLKGFGMDLSANPGFRKVFFSARCDCGTAALLSVEVAREKTAAEVRQALPELVSRLEGKAQSFHDMSCEAHRSMRVGPLANQ